MSVSPSSHHCHPVERKAWDLNPHDPVGVARFSKPARRAVSGYLPYVSVDPLGIEPRFPACRAGVVPLDHEPLCGVDRKGIEPFTPTLQESVAPLEHASPSLQEVRPGIEPGPRPYHRRVQPKHLQTIFLMLLHITDWHLITVRQANRSSISTVKVIPDGVEPSLSWVSSRRLSRWTTGS